MRLLAELPGRTGQDMLGTERVQVAIILLAKGDFARFQEALAESATDWRDLLMAADLAHGNWPDRLDQELGPAASRPPTRGSR